MSDLEDLIRRINRDMEEHRRQVDTSPQALAEQRRLIAEQVGWLQRYCWLPWALTVVTGIAFFWGPRRSR